MLFLVIKEILETRGIYEPYKYYGQKFNVVRLFAGGLGVENKISSLRKVAKMLDLPPRFIARMFQLGRIEDERFIQRYSVNNRDIFR